MLYYGYIGVIGVAVWAVLKYFKSGVSLPQIWCTYGATALAHPRAAPPQCCVLIIAWRLVRRDPAVLPMFPTNAPAT